jgi:hypothetical protein
VDSQLARDGQSVSFHPNIFDQLFEVDPSAKAESTAAV